jgi:hypothetical protein
MAINYKSVLTTGITSSTTVYNPTAAGIQATVISMIVANNGSANAVTANVTMTSGATTANVVRNVTIPVGTSLNVISADRLIVEQNEILAVSASGSVDVVLSTIEVT